MTANMFLIGVGLLVFCAQVFVVDGRRCRIPGVFYCRCTSDGVVNYLTCDIFPTSVGANIYTQQTVSISVLEVVRGTITYPPLTWTNLFELYDLDNNRFVCYDGTCRKEHESGDIHVDEVTLAKTSPFGTMPTTKVQEQVDRVSSKSVNMNTDELEAIYTKQTTSSRTHSIWMTKQQTSQAMVKLIKTTTTATTTMMSTKQNYNNSLKTKKPSVTPFTVRVLVLSTDTLNPTPSLSSNTLNTKNKNNFTPSSLHTLKLTQPSFRSLPPNLKDLKRKEAASNPSNCHYYKIGLYTAILFICCLLLTMILILYKRKKTYKYEFPIEMSEI